MKNIYITTTRLILLALLFQSCERFVETSAPKTESATATVYSDEVGATSVIRGIYHEMVLGGYASGQAQAISCIAGMSADEFVCYNPLYNEFANNFIAPGSLTNSVFWTSAYKTIYASNAALEGVSASTGINTAAKNQLIGEAKFLRAFSHFYLTSLYGDVPLVMTTDYRVNASLSRTGRDAILAQVIADLKDAAKLLSQDFQFTGSERVRVTSWAAQAMLARVYLFTGDWTNAEAAANGVIANTGLFKISPDLTTVFLKNSTEAIWQLMPVTPNQNTNEGIVFVPSSPTSLPQTVALTASLISSFETNDKRKTNWTGNQVVAGTTIYYPFKYKVSKPNLPLTEYSMVLRLPEQYLIRAEARAKQNRFTEAMADLDVIRLRAGLPSIQTKIAVPNVNNLLAAVEQERKVELFSEWGHRWFDLKRWNRADAVLLPLKPGWTSAAALYPIPPSELANNPNLGPQNPGY